MRASGPSTTASAAGTTFAVSWIAKAPAALLPADAARLGDQEVLGEVGDDLRRPGDEVEGTADDIELLDGAVDRVALAQLGLALRDFLLQRGAALLCLLVPGIEFLVHGLQHRGGLRVQCLEVGEQCQRVGEVVAGLLQFRGLGLHRLQLLHHRGARRGIGHLRHGLRHLPGEAGDVADQSLLVSTDVGAGLQGRAHAELALRGG